MSTVVTAKSFAARDDLPDWRFLLGGLEATYRAGSFGKAGELAAAVAAAADEAGHHPDLDLRYPDRLHVVLTTHAAGARVTTRDVELAGTISRLASEVGARSEPLAAACTEIAIDALDIDAVRPFWMAVLGYVEAAAPSSGPVSAIVDPARIGPPVWFQQMDAPRPQRNRIHVDVTVPHDVADERVATAVAAGGRVVSDRRARAFWVLADPEGNEACICTWQDRD
jgi:4a-hydroxytetrahydrobiopterin dehydratase